MASAHPPTGSPPYLRMYASRSRRRGAPSRPSSSAGRAGPAGVGGMLGLRSVAEGHRVRIELTGDLDVAAAAGVRARLEALSDAGCRHLLVDLSRLTFIDCSGLSVLLERCAAARREGWRLSIVQGPPAVRRLFELTETLDVLPFTTGDRA